MNDNVENCKRTWNRPFIFDGIARYRAYQLEMPQKWDERILFLKNKAGELLKTKGNCQKQTENKPKTKLPKLLKTKETPKKQSENKPKNKAGHVAENKGSAKNESKQTGKRLQSPQRSLPY